MTYLKYLDEFFHQIPMYIYYDKWNKIMNFGVVEMTKIPLVEITQKLG